MTQTNDCLAKNNNTFGTNADFLALVTVAHFIGLALCRSARRSVSDRVYNERITFR
jgi:hypothetical protein